MEDRGGYSSQAVRCSPSKEFALLILTRRLRWVESFPIQMTAEYSYEPPTEEVPGLNNPGRVRETLSPEFPLSMLPRDLFQRDTMRAKPGAVTSGGRPMEVRRGVLLEAQHFTEFPVPIAAQRLRWEIHPLSESTASFCGPRMEATPGRISCPAHLPRSEAYRLPMLIQVQLSETAERFSGQLMEVRVGRLSQVEQRTRFMVSRLRMPTQEPQSDPRASFCGQPMEAQPGLNNQAGQVPISTESALLMRTQEPLWGLTAPYCGQRLVE